MTNGEPFLAFQLDDRAYGLPLSQVERVVRAVDCTPLPEAPDIVQGVIDLHGELVPVLNIRVRFGGQPRAILPTDRMIIARGGDRRVVLAVDSVSQVVDRPWQPMDDAARQVVGSSPHVLGVVTLDDGVVLIHDLDRFLSLHETAELAAALKVQAAP